MIKTKILKKDKVQIKSQISYFLKKNALSGIQTHVFRVCRLSAVPVSYIPRQLSWLSSNRPYKYMTKHLNLSECTCNHWSSGSHLLCVLYLYSTCRRPTLYVICSYTQQSYTCSQQHSSPENCALVCPALPTQLNYSSDCN